jgi:RimJ/RimL family protein N-acetyltransferase
MASQKVLQKVGFKKEGKFANLFSLEENGEIGLFTAFSEKNGKNQKY